MNKLLDEKATVNLAKKLEKFSCVSSLNSGEYQEAWTLAQSFQELEEMFSNFNEKIIPKLINEDFSEAELKEFLIAIGLEFQHIFYHLRDPVTFKPYVNEDSISE